nr:3437_t:CDS:2 [Entrophospora candida]
MNSLQEKKIKTDNNNYIAAQKLYYNAASPGIIYINGLYSEMNNSRKVDFIRNFCARKKEINFLTFDHYAHGSSSGNNEYISIGRFYKDLCLIMEKETDGSPKILIGYSMGVWLALLLIISNHHYLIGKKIKGLIGISPAINFTQSLIVDKEEKSNNNINLKEENNNKLIYKLKSSYSDKDHRLSRDEDLKVLENEIEEMISDVLK